MKKILIIHPEFKAEFRELTGGEVDEDGSVNVSVLQEAVGGWIEHISTVKFFEDNNYDFFVNEEGKLMGLVPNPAATCIAACSLFGDWIAGKAVCVKRNGEKSVPLDEADEKKIADWFAANVPEVRFDINNK